MGNSSNTASGSGAASSLHLRKGCAKPIHGGHPWVFADAIARIDGGVMAGDEVRVFDERGACLGRGFFSPDSAISVRLLTRADIAIDAALIESRLQEALRLRREVLSLGSAVTSASSALGSIPISVPAREPVATGAILKTDVLSEKEFEEFQQIDNQIRKIEAFAAQYGMEAFEETAELRKRRDELLKKSGLPAGGDARPTSPRPAGENIQKNISGPGLGVEKLRAVPPVDPTNAYRLVNSEGDGLGGLTVDVYGEHLAVQIGTAGMDRRRETILDALEKLLHPKAILDRGEARVREIERLPPPAVGALRGTAPTAPFAVRECGIDMFCDLRPGQSQKTGLFLDQRENRRRFADFAAGRRVLDVFCYSGAFSLHAARAGAACLALIDSSAEALALARANLERNQVEDADLIHAEWAEGFKHLRESGRLFDLLVLDPPKFARSREQAARALSAYRDLNGQAVRLLAPGGVLFTCSCSGNVSVTDFERAVAAGIRASGRRAALLERRGAGPDHPVPPGFEQGSYLKCLVLQVV